MGCVNSKTDDGMEVPTDHPIFKTKFEMIVHKLKQIKEKSLKNQDVKTFNELDW